MKYGRTNRNIAVGMFLFIFGVIFLFPLSITVSDCTSVTSSSASFTFTIANTTASQRLCENEDSFCCIGTTWNVSIYLNVNSTSSVKFEFDAQEPSWEGVRFFEVAPSESYSGLYVQHLVSDNVGHWWIDYSLNESDQYASGTFTAQIINPGYSVWVGTGQLEVSNITAWLESRSQAKSTSSTSMSSPPTDMTTTTTVISTTTIPMTTPVRLLTVFLGITIVFVRRRNERL